MYTIYTIIYIYNTSYENILKQTAPRSLLKSLGPSCSIQVSISTLGDGSYGSKPLYPTYKSVIYIYNII